MGEGGAEAELNYSLFTATTSSCESADSDWTGVCLHLTLLPVDHHPHICLAQVSSLSPPLHHIMSLLLDPPSQVPVEHAQLHPCDAVCQSVCGSAGVCGGSGED